MSGASCWPTNKPASTLNPKRFDTQRRPPAVRAFSPTSRGTLSPKSSDATISAGRPPSRSLTPDGMELRWETIRALAANKQLRQPPSKAKVELGVAVPLSRSTQQYLDSYAATAGPGHGRLTAHNFAISGLQQPGNRHVGMAVSPNSLASGLLIGSPLGADDEERRAGCLDSTSAADEPASGLIPGQGSASGYPCPLRETATASRRTPASIARSPRPP
jgi:hypothetical protein